MIHDKIYKMKASFVSPEGPKTWANITGINFMVFILISVENCLYNDSSHDFSVKMRTDYN